MTNNTSSASSQTEQHTPENQLVVEETDQLDLTKSSKAELLHLLHELKIEDNTSKANAFLKQIKSSFDNLVEADKQHALQKYLSEGGEGADFEFKKDDAAIKFEKLHDVVKEKINTIFSLAEKDKEKNLQAKKQILERLRELIAKEETNQSIISLKEYQEQWRKLGPVPNAAHQELWQNYTALIDRFYNNRSIYFELKELDRKKNLEAKTEICEKAEKLLSHESINEAIRELKNLHDEYKNIGPVPKEDQEALWQKLKEISDKIYDKRTENLKEIKVKQDEALALKEQILVRLEEFVAFKSDKIDDWKIKTTELLVLQEDWKKIGNVPFEASKDISKKFWAAGKSYFANKEAFFAVLEAKKQHNLTQKLALCEEAENALNSEDTPEITSQIKELQRKWDKIGSVPIKQKDATFNRFKKACDTFFQRKREVLVVQEKQFETNLAEKLAVCQQIEILAKEGKQDEAALRALQQKYNAIGFVPKDKIREAQDRYNEVIQAFIDALDKTEGKHADFKLSLEISALKNTPDADKKLQKREGDVSRKIATLKSEIEQYGTNMEFFGRSANAEKLKKEIQQKIEVAKEEIKTLEAQLKIIKQA